MHENMSSDIDVYQNDMADEFPVLKAFQQYIDAEQAKARKRMMAVCAFFGFVLLLAVVVGLLAVSWLYVKNQTLNDRLIEYAMKDRERPAPAAQTSSKESDALQALSSKFESLQQTLAEERERSRKSAEEVVKKTVEKKGPSIEELEIERLKALLSAEKEKAALEREKQRQAELEAYRRKNYPELYGEKKKTVRRAKRNREAEEADREIESILDDMKPVNYFDEEDDDDVVERKNAVRKNDVKVPEIKDGAGNTWGIPLE